MGSGASAPNPAKGKDGNTFHEFSYYRKEIMEQKGKKTNLEVSCWYRRVDLRGRTWKTD